MQASHLQIRQARIDVPLQSRCAYLFVTSDQAKWDPWWLRLFDYLIALTPAEPKWRFEPIQNVYVMRPDLTEVQRSELAAFLRSAPLHEVQEHRTLRRAVGLSEESAKKLEVMFFSAATEPALQEREP